MERLEAIQVRENEAERIQTVKMVTFDLDSERVRSFSPKKVALGWPPELRAGYGIYKPDAKEVEVALVRGDKFIIYASAIHELGHLFQDELSYEISKMDQDKNWAEYIEKKEMDAEVRGLERVKKYCPEFIKQIKDEFGNEPSLKDVTFQQLYRLLNYCSVEIDNAVNSVSDEVGDEKREDAEIEAMKKRSVENLFRKIEGFRVGKLADMQLVEQVVKKVVAGIEGEELSQNSVIS